MTLLGCIVMKEKSEDTIAMEKTARTVRVQASYMMR